jgi:uncharacterized protein YdeI (YjbR/CyaY-like superfamily)
VSRGAASHPATAMPKTTETENPASAAKLPTKLFPSARAWENWLDANHGRSRGVWLKIAKPGAGVASVGYAEALETALLFGWIDGQKQRYDAHSWLQKFTPRGTRSRWSERNRALATRLMKDGRMRPAGRAAVEAAKSDGRWAQAYPSQRRATVPPDLQRALEAAPEALAFFATLDSHNRYAILYRVHEAKKPETRAKRIADFLRMLARHETLHPRPRRSSK